MKKFAFALVLIYLVSACNNNKNVPDVSGINVAVKIERMDRDFFQMDSNDLITGLSNLEAVHSGFYKVYMQGILGVSGQTADANTHAMVKLMLGNYASLYDVINKKINEGALEKEIRRGFQFVKYYFPEYKIPKVVTYMGTLDGPGIAVAENYIGVGLHQYAGKNFPAYQSDEVRQLYPAYISRRFELDYMPVNCLKGLVSDLFPDKSAGKPLVEQMIEKGKQWWLLDKFMPEAHDSLKTGYTKQQLDWVEDNEGLMWSYINKNEDPYSVTPATIQTYIGESPFTSAFSPELSPGNTGQWLGRQIVRKFEANNPSLKPGEIMIMDAKKILEGSKYKPK